MLKVKKNALKSPQSIFWKAQNNVFRVKPCKDVTKMSERRNKHLLKKITYHVLGACALWLFSNIFELRAKPYIDIRKASQAYSKLSYYHVLGACALWLSSNIRDILSGACALWSSSLSSSGSWFENKLGLRLLTSVQLLLLWAIVVIVEAVLRLEKGDDVTSLVLSQFLPYVVVMYGDMSRGLIT